ncbi:hypothetical protein DSUL_140029 [Desulfovibrionales bacterium]
MLYQLKDIDNIHSYFSKCYLHFSGSAQATQIKATISRPK